MEPRPSDSANTVRVKTGDRVRAAGSERAAARPCLVPFSVTNFPQRHARPRGRACLLSGKGTREDSSPMQHHMALLPELPQPLTGCLRLSRVKA